MSTPSPRPDAPTNTRPAPQPTHPVAGRTITESVPELRWTSVPEVEAYRLQIAASDAFTTTYYDETVDGPTAVDLDAVLPEEAGTVMWRVRAETKNAPWSVAASFTVANAPADDAQFLVNAPPVPIRPIDEDAVDANGATLTWEGVPEASGYRVQVGTTELIDDPLDLTLDQTTTLTLFDELPGGAAPLYWRVCALFPNDTEGPWSEVVQFRTDPSVEDRADEAPAADPEAEADVDTRRSAVAAGPAREAHTSSAMAIAFTGILLISFLLTILAVMVVG
ncbi:MAG: DNA-binding protein [Bacteroidetes bacterium SW_9_63_38]|nr:MAG: DNA-binding protein [Bacteroidetes bacterium SW_9_63_38]